MSGEVVILASGNQARLMSDFIDTAKVGKIVGIFYGAIFFQCDCGEKLTLGISDASVKCPNCGVNVAVIRS